MRYCNSYIKRIGAACSALAASTIATGVTFDAYHNRNTKGGFIPWAMVGVMTCAVVSGSWTVAEIIRAFRKRHAVNLEANSDSGSTVVDANDSDEPPVVLLTGINDATGTEETRTIYISENVSRATWQRYVSAPIENTAPIISAPR